MCKFKLLIVEDDEDELALYRTTIKRYVMEKKRDIEIVESKTLEDSLKQIDNSFDGVIIDLKLGSEGDEGNRVINEIHNKYRIPVAILTGTPGNADSEFREIIKVYKKGETGLDEILNDLIQIYDTGLTKIFGGRGHIEKTMNKVFWDNILPQLDSWKSYIESGNLTEKALLRFTINHLLELLNDDFEICYPEEMYISPVLSDNIHTGSIVFNTINNNNYIIMSPACDLVCRNDGNFKTDRILLCEVEDYNSVENRVLNGFTNAAKKRSKLKDLLKNNYTDYRHWLPTTSVFSGGFINFRWTIALNKSDYEAQFNSPSVQISSHFIRDIISRFASFYARQGQPDFDFDSISSQIIQNQVIEE